MSKTGDWIIEMQEASHVMSREAFIKSYGSVNVSIWDQVNNATPDPYENVQDHEEYYYPGSDCQGDL